MRMEERDESGSDGWWDYIFKWVFLHVRPSFFLKIVRCFLRFGLVVSIGHLFGRV